MAAATGSLAAPRLFAFVIDHGTLGALEEILQGLPSEEERARLLRVTAAMPRGVLGDTPMEKIAFARLKDMLEQAIADGKLEGLAVAAERAGGFRPGPRFTEEGERACETDPPSPSARGPLHTLRAWGDRLEEECAPLGIRPRLRFFE